MERRIVAETEEVRLAVIDFVQTNVSIEVLHQLATCPERNMCILFENNSTVTIRGAEDNIIEVTVDCPPINAMSKLLFDAAELI